MQAMAIHPAMKGNAVRTRTERRPSRSMPFPATAAPNIAARGSKAENHEFWKGEDRGVGRSREISPSRIDDEGEERAGKPRNRLVDGSGSSNII